MMNAPKISKLSHIGGGEGDCSSHGVLAFCIAFRVLVLVDFSACVSSHKPHPPSRRQARPGAEKGTGQTGPFFGRNDCTILEAFSLQAGKSNLGARKVDAALLCLEYVF